MSPFDEDYWPCAVFFQEDYAIRQRRGRERMARTRVVIAGLARDVAATLATTIEQIESTGEMFLDYAVAIYENDSEDGTLVMLREWSECNPRVTILSENLERPRWGSVTDRRRTDDLAYYRNRLHDLICAQFPEFDAVIILDMDLQSWSRDGLADTFAWEDWDVMGSNGITLWQGRPVYLDAWAMRALGHPEAHVHKYVNFAILPRGVPLQPVLSCFGGLAVYAMDAFKKGVYDGADCEHVTFHESLRKAGHARIFLNPSMILLYPEYEVLYPLVPPPKWAKLVRTFLRNAGTNVAPLANYECIYETPPVNIRPQSHLEMHLLIGEPDVLRASWSLKSFFRYSKLRPRLVIHDEGSLSENSIARLREHFPGCRILTSLDALLEDRLAPYPLCRYFRQAHRSARRLLDVLLLSEAEYVLCGNPNTLWLTGSPVVASSVRNAIPFFQEGKYEVYARRRRFMETFLDLKAASECNTSFVGYPRRDFLKLEFLESVIDKLIHVPREQLPDSVGYQDDGVDLKSADPKKTLDWSLMEKTLTALLFGVHPAEKLNNWPGRATSHQFAEAPILESTSLIHYVTEESDPRFFSVGVEHLLARGFLNDIAQRGFQR